MEPESAGGENMIELKPCPFCGGEANLEKINTRKRIFSQLLVGYVVSCQCCDAQGGIELDIPRAVNLWNRRTPEKEAGINAEL